jgi:hypothetical protein
VCVCVREMNGEAKERECRREGKGGDVVSVYLSVCLLRCNGRVRYA